jgi:hypothetical protein
MAANKLITKFESDRRYFILVAGQSSTNCTVLIAANESALKFSSGTVIPKKEMEGRGMGAKE